MKPAAFDISFMQNAESRVQSLCHQFVKKKTYLRRKDVNMENKEFSELTAERQPHRPKLTCKTWVNATLCLALGQKDLKMGKSNHLKQLRQGVH